MQADADAAPLPPTANLYVDLPSEGVHLQMCVMRPEPSEVCKPLPLFLPTPPTLEQRPHEVLSTIGLEPRVLPGAEVARPYESPSPTDSGAPSRFARASSSFDAAVFMRSLNRAALVADAAEAQRHLTLVMAQVQTADWPAVLEHDAFAKSAIVTAASAEQVARVAAAARSEQLCDALLRDAVPRLLLLQDEPMEEDEEEEHAAAQDTTGSMEAEMPPLHAPLSRPMSSLLQVLLRGGSHLRLDASSFDQLVTQPLVGVEPTGRGARAAAQAALVYAAAQDLGAP